MAAPAVSLILLTIGFGYRSFCQAQHAGDSTLMTIRVCAPNFFSINCDGGYKINVTNANYGRTSHHICSDQNEREVTNCVSESSLKLVRNACQDKRKCGFNVTNHFFEYDPCPGVSKYLEVNYTCGMRNRPVVSCNSNNICNETTEVCVDTSDGILICKCAENYQRGNGRDCQAITCRNGATRCNEVTRRCEDLKPGNQCVCSEGYVIGENNECTARTCQNAAHKCDEVTERCEDLNPGIQCVCAEGYVIGENNECTVRTCQNAAAECDEVTERCEDLNPGIQCVCAEGYVIGENNECTVRTCQNATAECDEVTERCEDLNPGIQCVCAEGYVIGENNGCTVSTCHNSPNHCNLTTESCQDRDGIQCVCAENYFKEQDRECIARTCQNSAAKCNEITERCEDLNPGIRCVCAEGYVRDSSNGCTEVKVNDSTTDTPEHVTRCPADVISIGGIALSFPSAETGEKVDSDQTCSQQLSENQTHPLATRVCNQVWQEPELQNCFDVDTPEEQLDVISQLNLTDVTIDQIANSLSLLTYQNDNISAHVLDVTVESLARIVEVGSPSLEVTDAVVGIVNSIMQINETVLDESEEVASVIPLMEKQITNIQRKEQNYSQILQNLNISAIKLQKSAFEGDFNFVDHSTNVNGHRDNKEPVQETSITLPYSVIEVVNEVYPKATTVPVTFITYRDSILFRENDNDRSDNRNATNEYIASYVISSTVELPNVTISGLPQNSSVIVSFSNMMLYERGNDAKSEVLCVYWEYTSENGEGKWSQAGCRTLSSGLKDVTCSCDHLTSFAVLVRTYDEEETGFHLVLQLITIIGCIISIVGLFLSLLCIIIIRKVRSKQQTHVHLNLCFALLGLYLSFLFGVGQADQPEMCRAMTSVIYFFCLSSMAWMSVEAFYIYKLIWKCKQHNIKHLIPVGVSFAWGLPGIAAVVIYFLDNTHDYEAEPDYCFIHPGPVLLYGFLLELLILFLYNSTVFVLVTYRISCRKIQAWNKDDRHQEMVIRVKSTFLFWLLLGISWIFGFLATFEHPTSIVFQIIFCVLLSLQGFFMFYMLIVQNPEMKKGISSISSFRSQSSSIQLGMHSSTAHSNQEQSRQENSSSLDHVYNSNNYV